MSDECFEGVLEELEGLRLMDLIPVLEIWMLLMWEFAAVAV